MSVVKSFSFPLLLAATVALAGCEGQKVAPRPANSVEINGLAVTIDVPNRSFTVGEQFKVTVTAHNTTKQPMRIPAGSGAPVYVRLWRYTGLAWEEVKRYPESAVMIMRPWSLAPGQKRTFAMQLAVEPDWPTGEVLRITAELNGRAEVAPGVTVEVSQPELTPKQ